MNKTRLVVLAGTGILAGALLVGGIGAVAAQSQESPGSTPGAPGPGLHQGHAGPGAGAAHGPAGAQMQTTLAQALGLSVDDLQAQLAAGKTVPQLAQERGVTLDQLHEAMQAVHQASGHHGPPGGGPGAGRSAGPAPNAARLTV